MTRRIKIDFVSDVSCPWCAIGLRSLDTALSRLGDDIQADIHFQPFELNPQMGAEGEDIGEHIARKYGSSPEQLVRNQEMIRERARQILNSDEYATEVREREQLYQNAGIHAVPAVILNDRYLIEGGQPVEAFERALRQVAQESRE
jgi:predicted DsbA family dithiol-disulfide isomerase